MFGIFQGQNIKEITLRKAAEQGDTEARYDLGECYYYGRSVGQDYAQAVKWYRKAAEQGDETAKEHLEEMSRHRDI